MKGKCLKIRLITNLHMGSGEANFNFIDNQVQRDPITTYPNMHSSGIKGALRDYFKNLSDSELKETEIFGAENNSSDTQQGKVSFIEGKLLALPVRGNRRSYYLGTTIDIIKEYVDFLGFFKDNEREKESLKKIEEKISKVKDKEASKVYIFDEIDDKNKKGLSIEGFLENEMVFCEELKSDIEGLLGLENVVIFEEGLFKEEISRRLPVIARNQLEDGVSKNLWYEEVVPRESVFYTGIVNSQNFNGFDNFINKLTDDMVQIGANATIGYGYTKFIEVK